MLRGCRVGHRRIVSGSRGVDARNHLNWLDIGQVQAWVKPVELLDRLRFLDGEDFVEGGGVWCGGGLV
jgi:hypothetical protein